MKDKYHVDNFFTHFQSPHYSSANRLSFRKRIFESNGTNTIEIACIFPYTVYFTFKILALIDFDRGRSRIHLAAFNPDHFATTTFDFAY